MALVIRCAAQPSSVFGSPETLVERGRDDLAKATAAFGAAIARRCDGKRTAKGIRRAIDAAARAWSSNRFALPVRRELERGLMLGALDADYEVEAGERVAVESFRDLHAAVLFRDDPANDTDPAFAKRPQVDAVAEFIEREVVTREVFDGMVVAAQRRAFTVAGAVERDVVRTVKRELARQVAQGADLRDFKKRVLPRLEAAGWTPVNPSHAENVFRTNVLGAYNSGRAAQMTQPAVLRA